MEENFIRETEDMSERMKERSKRAKESIKVYLELYCIELIEKWTQFS